MSSNSPPPQYPQQGGYIPQQGGYVVQQGYVPQQGGYVSPQGYVSQQMGYVQGGYSPQPQYQGGIPLQQQPQQPQVVYSPTSQMTPQVGPIVGAPREWKFGLFDCFADCGLCLKTWCCPCITFGETKAKVNKDPGSCTCNSLLYCCFVFAGFECILGSLNRNEMRSKYNIDGSGCGDFCTHFCCGCCALIQENREANSIP